MILKILIVLTLANSITAKSPFPFSQNLTGVDPNSLQCDPNGLKPLLLPHHEDCDKFYMCTHGEEVLFSCPKGTVFDFERQICNWPRDVECILRDQQLKDSSEEDNEDGSGGGGDVEWGNSDDGVTDEPELTTTTTSKPGQKPPKPDQKPPNHEQKPPKLDQKPPKPDQKPPKPDQKPPKPDQKPPKPDQKPPKPDQKPNDNHNGHHHHHGKHQHQHNHGNNRNADKKLKCDDPKNSGRQEPHSTDCQRYWRCENGHLHQVSCSDGLFYNPKTRQCDHEGNVRCDINNDELSNEYIVA